MRWKSFPAYPRRTCADPGTVLWGKDRTAIVGWGAFLTFSNRNSLPYNLVLWGYTKFKFAHFFWHYSSGIIWTEIISKKAPLLHRNSTFVCYTTFGGASDVKNDFDYRGWRIHSEYHQGVPGGRRLINYPLYCPKCKRESLIQAKQLHIVVIKEPDA